MRTSSLSLLFVCTANIARSPYAEGRARMLLGEASVRVGSAGVPGYPDRPMDPEMAEQLRLRGGDPSGHRSRRLDAEILARADVVLTFTFEHQVHILQDWPEVAERTFGLRQFADALTQIDATALDGPMLVTRARAVAAANSMAYDFDDPHGQGRRAASVSAAAIDDCIGAIASSLVGSSQGEGLSGDSAPRRALPGSAPWRLRRPAPRRAVDG